MRRAASLFNPCLGHRLIGVSAVPILSDQQYLSQYGHSGNSAGKGFSVPISLCANIVLCQSVLTETTGLHSAIRNFDHFTLPTGSNFAYFYALTILTSRPMDFLPHILSIRMVGQQGESWNIVASAPDHRFSYAYKIDPSGPGGFNLKTEFSVDVSAWPKLGTFFVQAWLDGERVAQAPITLRRS